MPMGFANSVSLAQHVHRNLTLWSSEQPADQGSSVAAPEAEIRKDRAVTIANPSWRIYLDNFDLLGKSQVGGFGDPVRDSVAGSVGATPRA